MEAISKCPCSINSTFLDSIDAYIHGVSEVKQATNNPDLAYFNLTLQSPEKVFRGVSYRVDVRETLENAQNSKSPVKITNIRKRPNKLFPDKTDITLTGKSVIQPSTEDFEYIDQSVVSPTSNVADIKAGKCEDRMVTVVAHVKAENCPTQLITTRHSSGPCPVKLAVASDDTAAVELELWGNYIASVHTNGTYKLTNLLIKEWPATVFKLSTCKHTIIASFDHQFKSLYNIEEEKQNFQEVSFPPLAVDEIEFKFICFKCRKAVSESVIENTMFECLCGAKSLKVSTRKDITVKIMFLVNNSPLSLQLRWNAVEQFYKKISLPVPNSSDKVVQDILSCDKNLVMMYDQKRNCVGFKS